MKVPLDPVVMPPPAPGYEDHPYTPLPPRENPECQRLVWSLQGPLEDSVFVTGKEDSSEGPLEPLLQKTTDGDVWHPLSNESVAQPPIKSMTVSVYYFNHWADDWQTETHCYCRDLDVKRVFQDQDGNEMVEQKYDEDNDDEEGFEDKYPTFDKLIRCCGEERPPDPVTVEVLPSTEPFVTFRDYPTTVHAWIMDQRGNLLLAMSPHAGRDDPSPEETRLWVDPVGLEEMFIETEEEREDHLKRARQNAKGKNVPARVVNIYVRG